MSSQRYAPEFKDEASIEGSVTNLGSRVNNPNTSLTHHLQDVPIPAPVPKILTNTD